MFTFHIIKKRYEGERGSVNVTYRRYSFQNNRPGHNFTARVYFSHYQNSQERERRSENVTYRRHNFQNNRPGHIFPPQFTFLCLNVIKGVAKLDPGRDGSLLYRVK